MRFKCLFPHDPERRARMKDLEYERAAMYEYEFWVKTQSVDEGVGTERREFYSDLHRNLAHDYEEVSKELETLFHEALRLGRFEYHFLENDGSTERIEGHISKGIDVLPVWGDEAKAKYGHLKPLGFEVDHVATFQLLWLDPHGGTTMLEYNMKNGRNVLKEYPACEEACEKYGHLSSFFKPAKEKEQYWVDAEWGCEQVSEAWLLTCGLRIHARGKKNQSLPYCSSQKLMSLLS